MPAHTCATEILQSAPFRKPQEISVLLTLMLVIVSTAALYKSVSHYTECISNTL